VRQSTGKHRWLELAEEIELQYVKDFWEKDLVAMLGHLGIVMYLVTEIGLHRIMDYVAVIGLSGSMDYLKESGLSGNRDYLKEIVLSGSTDYVKEIGLSGSMDFLKEIGRSSSMDFLKEIGLSGSRDYLKEIGLSSSRDYLKEIGSVRGRQKARKWISRDCLIHGRLRTRAQKKKRSGRWIIAPGRKDKPRGGWDWTMRRARTI